MNDEYKLRIFDNFIIYPSYEYHTGLKYFAYIATGPNFRDQHLKDIKLERKTEEHLRHMISCENIKLHDALRFDIGSSNLLNNNSRYYFLVTKITNTFITIKQYKTRNDIIKAIKLLKKAD